MKNQKLLLVRKPAFRKKVFLGVILVTVTTQSRQDPLSNRQVIRLIKK